MRVDVAGDVTASRHEARIVSSLRRYPLSKTRLIRGPVWNYVSGGIC